MKSSTILQKHLCAHCHTERTSFNVRGSSHYKARKNHDLCSRCFSAYLSAYRRWCRENTLDGWLI